MKQDTDKLKEAIEDGIVVYEAIKEDLKDGKISLTEGISLAFNHSGKAVRFIGSIKEIAEEIKDLDGEEVKEIIDELSDKFGGSEEAKDAIEQIAIGAGYLNDGIQKLIAIK